MQSFPLVFKFEDLVAGDGFVCRILAFGRALLVQEEDSFWLYGVTPGGVAGGGRERSEAFSSFKQGYLSVLFDIAAEAPDSASFEQQVREFFDAPCEALGEAWQEARTKVLRGEVSLDALAKVPADAFPPQITITVSSQPTAQANPEHADTYFLSEAA